MQTNQKRTENPGGFSMAPATKFLSGAPGDGNAQVSYTITPGSHSNPHLDVDVIIVIDKNGNVKIYAFVGLAIPKFAEEPQLAIVDKKGNVTGPLVLDDKNIIGRTTVGMYLNNVKENFDETKKRRYWPRRGYPDMSRYREGLNPR